MPVDPKILKRMPELDPVVKWGGWPEMMFASRRVVIAEILWALKLGGPVVSPRSSRDLRDRCVDLGAVEAARVSDATWFGLLGEMSRGSTATYKMPVYISRELNGKHTLRIELAVGDDGLPPNPYEVYEAVAKRPGRVAMKDALSRVAAFEPPDPGEGAAKLRSLLGIEEAPSSNGDSGREEAAVVASGEITYTPAIEVPPVEAPVVEDPPVECRSEIASLFAPERSALIDELVAKEDRSLADDARLLMRLAGDILTKSALAAVAEPVFVDVPADVSPDEDLDVVKGRLAVALEESARFRRAAEKAETQRQMAESALRKTEAALLAERERAEQLERNVDALLKGQRVPNESGFKALRGMAQERPRVPVG